MIIYCYNYNYNYNITQLYSKKTNYKSFTYFGNKIIFYYQRIYYLHKLQWDTCESHSLSNKMAN